MKAAAHAREEASGSAAVDAGDHERQSTADRFAAGAAPPVAADGARDPAAETRQVLAYIQAQAKLRGAQPLSISKDSLIYKRLSEHYLKEYLAKPSKAAGKAAVAKLGEQTQDDEADPNDYWESQAKSWNAHPVPPALKLLIPKAPDEMGAATAVMKQENRGALPYLDAPHMVGKPNTDTGVDADVHGGGKNISQLMHWATGIKYSAEDPQAIRDLFLAYEFYHLEGFDKFGEDSINDLISEDAGRIMGRQLQAGEITASNFGDKLDAGFAEARAWVGSLIKARQADLDAVITSETPVESEMWFGKIPGQVRWWGESSTFLDLKHGKTVAEVCADARTAHFIDIYSLIYYSEAWQAAHGDIDHSTFTESMLAGKYDTAFEKSVKSEELTPREKVDAYIDARAPWLPGFGRDVIVKLAGKRLAAKAGAAEGAQP